jgi:hypothetical protein
LELHLCGCGYITDFDIADICKVIMLCSFATHYVARLSGCIPFLFIQCIVTVVCQGLLRLQTLDLRACRRVGNKGIGHFVAAYAAPPLILRPHLCPISHITGRDVHTPRVSRPARLQWLDHGQRAYGKV